MRKLINLIALLIMASSVTWAQDKKSFTLEDLMPGGNNYYNLLPQNLYGLQWWGDVCINADIEEVKTIQPANGKENVLITLQEVNELLANKELGKINHFRNASFPYAEKMMLVNTTSNKVLIDLTKKEIIWSQPLSPKAANQDWNKESRSLAYTLDNNLFVTTADGKTQQVTDEPKGIVCGQSVHRQEFGISKGTFWSPKGNLLAFYRMDESMVTDYPQVNTSTRIATLEPDKYPMAGMTSHKVTVGIYNPATQKTVYLKAGDPTDRYFTNISWAPDEKSLYLIEVNRDQNHAKLCQYNAETGEPMGVLYEEMHPKYVEPQNPIVFLPWDPTKFIYQSQRDGYNHLYLFETNAANMKGETYNSANGGSYFQAGKVKQLTKGNWLVSEILGFNTKRKEVIFTAVEGLRSGHFAVNVSNGKISQPFENCKESEHSGTLSASGTYLIDRYSTKDQPRVINLVDTKNFKETVNLLTAENPYDGYQMPSIETGTIKAADGTTDLHYRLMKPANFDPAKKYPVIVYVYGGPHAQCVTGGWQNGARGWDTYMASKGYIMFTIDNRGSSNRGLTFENATFRRLGIEEGKDQVKGVEFLKSLPYVDSERIGVHGWSFGGHMTTALMLRYPEIFKVGVAGGPVIDWGYYEIMYGERYMDTPESNPEGYKECNLKNLAGQLKGHLLIIHDDHDDTCVPQHTLSFMKACVDARTYPDLFIYPCHKHNVAGRDRVHLHEKITRYFEQNL